ncbi:NAD(P)H-hydrate epimerase [Candidatus Woesearchaeota archaeon]|jgi:ADP-dependent NAD(P)H-hydrate dehydratase / NAD(P)H-hydrate epimerase|nr:NAD(P)H-hydrate epimerase [Candidatus Woesearchaeota archaeon]
MITTAEMIELENQAELNGMSKLDLMEKAGEAISEEIQKRYDKDQRILFMCFHGNNGGDGFVAARYLADCGYKVKLSFIGDASSLKFEAETNLKRLYEIQKEENKEIFVKSVADLKCDVVVDALLGIGVEGELREPITTAVQWINSRKVEKISIDVPTGVNPDTGEYSEQSINADLIIAIHDTKPGLEQFGKKVVVADIGLGVF